MCIILPTLASLFVKSHLCMYSRKANHQVRRSQYFSQLFFTSCWSQGRELPFNLRNHSEKIKQKGQKSPLLQDQLTSLLQSPETHPHRTPAKTQKNQRVLPIKLKITRNLRQKILQSLQQVPYQAKYVHETVRFWRLLKL